MVHNPGGDWNPGWGVALSDIEKHFKNNDTSPIHPNTC